MQPLNPTPPEHPDPPLSPGVRPRGFLHQRLDAYQGAIELLRGVSALSHRIPRGLPDVRDQLLRAALAVPRNIAEAASRYRPADRRARFSVARGECAECDAALEALHILAPDFVREILVLRQLADRVGAMLTRLILRETRRVEGRG